MLNKDLNRLEMILDSISKIEGYTKKFESPDSFNADEKSFDATMMNFVVIWEMVLKLSDEFKNMHPGINWIKIKALRNIVAHDYFGIDAEAVW